jgi:hypothetical protein
MFIKEGLMSKPQPTHSQYRRETRYFIRKYGRVAFFKACSIVNSEQSTQKISSKQEAPSKTAQQLEDQLMTVCNFSATDSQRFTLLAPLQAQCSEQNEFKLRSMNQ